MLLIDPARPFADPPPRGSRSTLLAAAISGTVSLAIQIFLPAQWEQIWLVFLLGGAIGAVLVLAAEVRKAWIVEQQLRETLAAVREKLERTGRWE